MHAADTGSDKAFTGKLVKRQYKRGQQYAQLVFENRRGTHLSLSRNPKTVNSLMVGERYRVAGPEFAVGEKTFIHEPEVAPAPFNKKRMIVSFAVAFFLVLTGTVFAARHFADSKQVAAQSGNTYRSGHDNQQQDVQGAETQTASTADQPAETAQPTTTTTPKTTTTAAVKKTSTTTTTQSSSQSNSTTPTEQTAPSSDTTSTDTDTTTPVADDTTPAPDDTTKPSDGNGTVDGPADPTPPPVEN